MLTFCSDNGGPVYLPGAANNHPLKGGKYSDWEGGVRTNALVSGGYGIPDSSRGGTYDGIVSIADWFGMFCDLFGVDKHDSKSDEANEWIAKNRPDLATLPPVDSLSGLFNSITSLDTANQHPILPLSPTALLAYPYKIVTGIQTYSNYTGQLFPNCSTISNDNPYLPWHNDSHLMNSHLDWSLDPDELDRHLWAYDCGDSGCLYNVKQDPNETTDLAERMPDVLERLRSLLDEHAATIFNPDRGVEDVRACQYSASVNGGYYGPWISLGEYYTGPFRELEPLQQDFVNAYNSFLDVVSKPAIEEITYKITQRLYPKFMVPPLVASFDQCINQVEEEVYKLKA